MSDLIYRPNIEMFYGTVNDANSKIIPAPNMSISINYDYANDTIVGYYYTITLTGQITSLDLRNLSYNDEYDPTTYNQGNIGSLADSIEKLRFLLVQNGNVLHITDAETGIAFFKAKGGILRSFNAQPSENNWASSAGFTATIEFNAVEINDVENCYTSFLDTTGFPTDDRGIVDINAFKLRSFSDSWSFTFEQDSTAVSSNTEYGNFINLDNSFFSLSYNANATGKNYYIYSDEDNSTATLIPAWEQAKNFVQYRLYNQVTSLLNGVLKTYDSGCGSEDGLNDINIPGTTPSGLLSSLGDSNYKIYNEEISCDSSESNGTFSAQYSCTVRRSNGGYFSPPECFHRITKSINTDYTGRPSRTISLNGTIEGLIEGGIVRTNQPIQLPAQGKFFIYNTMSSTKFANASNLLSRIYTPGSYNGGFGSGKRDFNPIFKNSLGINAGAFSDLNIVFQGADPPHPTKFDLTYDTVEGTITYSVDYDSQGACGDLYRSITVDIEDSVKSFVTHQLPFSYGCGVIQRLGTRTARKVTYTVEGINYADASNPGTIRIEDLISCGGSCGSDGYFPVSLPNGAIVTDQSLTQDPITGKFTAVRSYICEPQCS